jgi:CPA2 family monovalent cation:H+ antiporter-2
MITAREILNIVQTHNPGVEIIVRANDMDQIKELQKLNVKEIVQPEFEASLEMIRQTLLHLNYRVPAIQSLIDEIKETTYSTGKTSAINSFILKSMKDTPFLIETGWYEIKSGDHIEGKSIRELEVRKNSGVSIVGLMRSGSFIPNPEPDLVFIAGDLVAVIGTEDKRELFQKMYLA